MIGRNEFCVGENNKSILYKEETAMKRYVIMLNLLSTIHSNLLIFRPNSCILDCRSKLELIDQYK